MNSPRLTACASCLLLGAVATSTANAADLGLNIYGDLDFLVQKTSEGTTNAFMVPRLELFFNTTQDRVSFLAEMMMEVGEDNAFVVDVERVEVAYLFSEWLRLRVGRFHTAIGYYNDSYHHGRYFQMTTDRPEMVRFEDEGGLIPAHSVGVHLDGRFSLGGAGWLRYDADLANGRGRIPDEVTNLEDHNRGKAVNLRLRYESTLLEGLILGANVYLDSIEATDIDPAVTATTHIDERIYGAHLAYLEHGVQLVSEVLRVEHRLTTGTGVTSAGFAELGYALGNFVPYARYEVVKFPDVLDPFFLHNVLGQRGSFSSILAGVRYTFSEYLALKVELGRVALDAGGTIQMAALQCAFAF
jgi:Gram-negative porin